MSNNIGFNGKIRTSYADSTPWWPEEKTAPKDAPNIICIVLDDTGYAQLGCYGSLVETPHIDSLAEEGLRYSNFHVNAMCSPTRASLLTGCNHHTVGLGFLANFDFGFPSLSGSLDQKYGYLSETLLENGYSTFAVGKWHLTKNEAINNSGPFHQWPLGRGFEKYYGFLGAMTSQFHPDLVQDNQFVDPPKLPEDGYHLSEDLIDKAAEYIGDQKSNAPEKPFFCYLAFGAMHGPHHAPKEYMDRYKGKFDEGWDVYRQKVFERQKQMGLIPEDTQLTERNHMALEWSSCSERQKKVFARYMEAFAGFLTYTDDQIGRLINYLKKIDQYDKTLIILVSDNGASGEGGPTGIFNELYHLRTMQWPDLCSEKEYDLIGTPESNGNYPAGWAWAGNAPLKWYKTWTHAGGVKVPFIIRYPEKIKEKGGLRNQYHHVIDIYPTILELCGINQPESIKGVKQETKHGTSMAYTFDNPNAPTQRQVQYYEMLGNRGIWADGWKAVANHVDSASFETDQWELYHTDVDFSEANDLAQTHPEKLREMIDLWWNQAGEYGVLPMIESFYRKKDGFDFNKIACFRPVEPKTRYVFYPEKRPGSPAPKLTNKSFTISATINHHTDDSGVLLSMGVNVDGYVLYIEDNAPRFYYKNLDGKNFEVLSQIDLSEGKHLITVDFKLTGTNLGECRLIVDSTPCDKIEIEAFPLFSVSGGCALGRYCTSPIYAGHKEKGYFNYTGRIERILFNLDRPINDNDLMIELKKEEERA